MYRISSHVNNFFMIFLDKLEFHVAPRHPDVENFSFWGQKISHMIDIFLTALQGKIIMKILHTQEKFAEQMDTQNG